MTLNAGKTSADVVRISVEMQDYTYPDFIGYEASGRTILRVRPVGAGYETSAEDYIALETAWNRAVNPPVKEYFNTETDREIPANLLPEWFNTYNPFYVEPPTVPQVVPDPDIAAWVAVQGARYGLPKTNHQRFGVYFQTPFAWADATDIKMRFYLGATSSGYLVETPVIRREHIPTILIANPDSPALDPPLDPPFSTWTLQWYEERISIVVGNSPSEALSSVHSVRFCPLLDAGGMCFGLVIGFSTTNNLPQGHFLDEFLYR